VLAARLLALAGEPIEAVMNLGGMNKAKLNAIAAINSTAAPARLSVGPKAASPSDLEDYKLLVRTQFTIALNSTKGNPRCDESVKRAVGAGLWNRLCVRNAQVGASDVVKELHALGEGAFVKEAGRKASIWWNQKGSEAARMKEKWLEDNKKRPASAPSDEPAPKHHAAALASAPAASAAAGVSVLHL